MPGLSQSDLDSYRHQGCLVLREGLQQEDLLLLRGLISTLIEEHAQKLYRAGKMSSLHETESFERRLAVINEEVKFRSRLEDLTRRLDSPELFNFVRHPAILGSISSLLGPEVAWTGSFVTRPKLPQNASAIFPWHQDSQYYGEPTQHLHVVSVWIPLVDVDENNGCLYVLPGSHRWGLLEGNRGADNLMITTEEVDKRGKPTALPMSQGDILFFSNLIFHSSKPNTTDKVRWSVDLRYVAPSLAAALTEQQKQGYDTLSTHYGVAPITVRSRRPENVADLAQLQAFASRYSAQKASLRKGVDLKSGQAR
ncbi:MAG: hypothetical protein CME19_22905 [Gemmatimonadetes bacterium]|nr:hypothetical protein [Gemmatimonadota bacterium]